MAVQLAAAAGPYRPVHGVFALTVRASGHDGKRLFLNSETDYRNPRNLSIALSPAVDVLLQAQLGTPEVGTALKGKRVLVRGAARLIRINFRSPGQPAGKYYYYQTHVDVDRLDQLQIGV